MRTGVVVAGVVLLAGCKATDPPPLVVATESPRAVPSPTATVEAPTPPPAAAPPEIPAPHADFERLGDIRAAGPSAVGKIARGRFRRDHYTSGKQFTGVACDAGSGGTYWLRYSAEQRDLVRAMHDTPKDACASVSFEIVVVHGGSVPLIEGKIVHIGSIAPKPAAPAPAGADFATIDDAILAGSDGKGKLVTASIWAYDGDPKELWVHDCGRSDPFVFVIPKTAAQRKLAAQLPNEPRACGTATLRIENPDFVLSAGHESMQRALAVVVSVP